MPTSNTSLPVVRLQGSHHAIGLQYGQACRERIQDHLALALDRIRQRNGWSVDEAVRQALAYRPVVRQHAAFFDDEVQGLAEGAGLTLGEAYLLQLRAELSPSLAVSPEDGECTTLAVTPAASADGGTYAGQVADLPTHYRELGVLLEIYPEDQPALLMYAPAGQLSYIGVNAHGLACFANYLHCDGWRLGMPRYFLSRIALTTARVEAAIARVRAVPRASSRNLLLADAAGSVADLETTVTEDAVVEPSRGVLAHANHYVSPQLARHERGSAAFLRNSHLRHARMRELLEQGAGRLDIAALQAIARDRHGHPDCISRAPDDGEPGVMSIAAVIAAPDKGVLWAAKGPPHAHDFQQLAFDRRALA